MNPISLDRGRFKATSKTTLGSQHDAAVASAGIKTGGNNTAGFLAIAEGSNKFRIYPAHNSEQGESFAHASVRTFLMIDVPKKDAKGQIELDRKGQAIMERKARPIFNSKMHSEIGKKAGFDLVEQFIEQVKRYNDENFDAKTAEAKSKLLSHFQQGIAPKLGWVMYVDKITTDKVEFGRVEISNGVKQKLNELAMTEDPEDQIETDPFTDPDTGIPFLLTYTKGASPQDVYKISLAKTLKALTDEQLLHFDKQPSLAKIYGNTFKRSDFDKQVQGIRNYDELNKIGVFYSDDFQATIALGEEYFPEEVEPSDADLPFEKGSESRQPLKRESVVPSVRQRSAPVTEEEEEEEEEGGNIDTMGRDDLKRYIKANGLKIVVTPSKTDKILRAEIKSLEGAHAIEETDEEDEEVAPEPPKPTGSSRLAALRKGSKVAQADEDAPY